MRDSGSLPLWVALLFLVGATMIQAQTDSLVLLSPTGGEKLYTNRDSTVTIRWSGVPDTLQVRIEWSDDGRTWHVIADSAQGLRYTWTIAGMPISSTYRIRVLQARAPQGSDNAVYTGHQAVVAEGAWSPSSDRVITVSATPDIWEARIGGSTPLLSLTSKRQMLSEVRWTSDSSKVFLLGPLAAGLSIYTMADNAQAWQYDCACEQFDMEVNKTGSRFVLAGLRKILLFDYPNTTPTREIVSTTDVLDVAMDSSETHILVCADQASVYPVVGGLPVVFRKHSSGVLRGAFHPNGKLVVTIGGDATIRLWDATTGVEQWVAQDPKEGVRSVAFSPDGSMIAVGMSDSTVTVWNTADGTLRDRFANIAGAVTSVEWAVQGDRIVTSGEDNVAHVLSVVDHKRINTLSHQNDVTSAHWSPDGSTVLTTSMDGTARTWRISEIVIQADTSGTFSYTPPPPSFARFRTSGGTVAIGDELTVALTMEASNGLQLSDIDSVQFILGYDATMLYNLQSTIPIVSTTDSARYRIMTLAPVVLPRADTTLGTLRFKATLGVDSITSLRFSAAKQIGREPGIRAETVADQITVTGICRANNTPRLYNPLGLPLSIIKKDEGGFGLLELHVEEVGSIQVKAYTVQGECCWSTILHRNASDPTTLTLPLEHGCAEQVLLLVASTASQSCTLVVEDVR